MSHRPHRKFAFKNASLRCGLFGFTKFPSKIDTNYRMKKLTIIALLLFAAGANAQTKTFRWSSELCDHVGTYNGKKYTEAQLSDTLKLLNFNSIMSLPSFPNVWKWEDTEKLDAEKLRSEYETALAGLKALNVVPLPYFQDAKKAQIKELEQVYGFYRTQLLAYKTPEVLRDYPGAESCKAKFAEPLIKRDESLLKAWLDVNMDSRSKNGDPDRLKREFDAKMDSPDKIKFAIVEVMGFGWGNCVNDLIERDEGASNGGHDGAFRKLFTRVRDVNCDIP